MTVDLTASTYEEFIANDNGIVVVDFWATWCGPCKMVSPALEQLADEGLIHLGKVDVDAERDLTISNQVQSMPTMVVYGNGRELGRIVGAMSYDALKDRILELVF